MLKPAHNNMLIDENGSIPTQFVNSFVLCELAYPNASVIGLRLLDRDEKSETEVPPERAQQTRMSTQTARRLARALLEMADQLDGADAPRQ